MQDLVDLLEKYASGISATFVSTKEDDIKRIEATAGPLPGAYVRFLRTMGASMGDFEIDHGNADLGSDGNWDAPEEIRWLKDSPCVYIGQDNSPDGLDYFLDRSKPHGEDDCMVVQLPLQGGAPRCEVYSGLEEMLYYNVYESVRLPLLPYHAKFLDHQMPEDVSRWPRPDDVCALAARLGFERIRPATRCALYERGDASLLLYQNPSVPAFQFVLATDDRAELDRMAPLFLKETGEAECDKFVVEPL
jgi:hypothetical protein